MINDIKDSGSMQEFSTGAHRDNALGKGRCDLLPLRMVSKVMNNDPVLLCIAKFAETRDVDFLGEAIRCSMTTVDRFKFEIIKQELEKENISLFDQSEYDSYDFENRAVLAHMMLEVSKQYENGALKYGANNWQLGMPVDRYIDSGVRHYLKTLRGDADELHYRGFLWNLLCAMWTAYYHPELNSNENE